MTTDEAQNLYTATYGAVFALYVRDFMAEGRGAPESEDYERFDEEADFIAQEAVAQRRAAEHRAVVAEIASRSK